MGKTFDPFDAEEVQAAWPLLSELRRETAVAPMSDGMKYVTRHEDCRAVLRDTTSFSNARGFKAPGVVVPPEDRILGEMDPPQHTPVRRVMVTALTPKVVRALGPSALAPWDLALPKLGSRPAAAELITAGLVASAARLVLCRAPNGNLPTEQEKAVTAKRAPIGLKKPKESRLDGISGAYTSKIDGSAMRTAREEQPEFGVDHAPVCTIDGLSSPGGDAAWGFLVATAAGPASR